MTTNHRKCRECDIYYVPGKTDCDCGASMFPPLRVEPITEWADYLIETGRAYQ